MNEITFPQTLQAAVTLFADPVTAHNFVRDMRWPDGEVVCAKCGHNETWFLAKQLRWKCKLCKRQFSVKVGTIFEDSPLGLDKWLTAMWLISAAKNGISSYEIHRAIGVTQKSAWFMLHRIRHAMETHSIEKFSGEVEADETFLGGKERNKHADKKKGVGGGTFGKEIVMGMLERETGMVRTKHIKDTTKATLQGEVKANVEAGSKLYTDEARGYQGLNEDYVHETVNHLEEYVRGAVHTNNLENYWSLFKRCFHGTWTHVSADHLHRYLVEEEFRFNLRGEKDGGRFVASVMQAPGKRLDYKTLTGKKTVEG